MGMALHPEEPARQRRFPLPDNTYVSNSRDMQRELESFDSMVRADAKAIHELYRLDGTLVKRHVPSGVIYP